MRDMDISMDDQANPLLVFVHVPKTAGVTFSAILENIYRSRIYSIYGTAELAKFQQLSESERGRYNLLQGHFPYGIHAYVPQPVRYITFLRDPVARVISLYYFFLRYPASYLHHKLSADNVSLDEFVTGQFTDETRNFQTRMIAGTERLEPLFPEPDATTLALAKQRLATDFTAFGITEHFDASLILISHALGWQPLSHKMLYKSRNVAPVRNAKEAIDPETISAIRHNNQLDLELYDYAVDLFSVRWAAKVRFRMQLQLFRRVRPLWLKLMHRASR